MRSRGLFCLGVCTLLLGTLCGEARAQPGVQPTDESLQPDAEVAAPAAPELDVLPLDVGDPAPHAGLLVDEARFTRFLRLDIDLKEAKLEIEARDRALKRIEDQLAQAKEKSWWGRNRYWVGVTTGIAATVLLIWGTANTLDTLK